jgi:hypothetical protein
MWAWWSSHHDTGRHEDHPIPRLARSGSIEVPQQGDLGTVVDHLAMDMQDQRCHDSVSKPGSRHRSARPSKSSWRTPAIHREYCPSSADQSQISRSGVVV